MNESLDLFNSTDKHPSQWTDKECREHSWIHSVETIIGNDESANKKMSNIEKCIREPYHQINTDSTEGSLKSRPIRTRPPILQSSAIITDSDNISAANENPVYTIVVKQQNTFVQKLTFVLHLYLTVVVSYFIYHLKDDFIQQTKTVQYSFSLFS